MKSKKIPFFIFLIAIFFGGLWFYYNHNPQSNSFFLKCPFKLVTGYDCPGCDSQRALHALLHGDISQAFSFNPLFILAIPYVFVGILFEWFGLKFKYLKIRKLLFGTTAIYFLTAVIIFLFVFRNI